MVHCGRIIFPICIGLDMDDCSAMLCLVQFSLVWRRRSRVRYVLLLTLGWNVLGFVPRRFRNRQVGYDHRLWVGCGYSLHSKIDCIRLVQGGIRMRRSKFSPQWYERRGTVFSTWLWNWSFSLGWLLCRRLLLARAHNLKILQYLEARLYVE